MPEKKIHSGVVVDDVTITDAEELQAAAKAGKVDLDYLTKQGAVSGFAGALPEESAGEGAFGPGSEKSGGEKKSAPKGSASTGGK